MSLLPSSNAPARGRPLGDSNPRLHDAYQRPPRAILIRFSSADFNIDGLRNPRRRSPLFPLIRCPELARLWRTFPVAVIFTRFFKPLCVFILGIFVHRNSGGPTTSTPGIIHKPEWHATAELPGIQHVANPLRITLIGCINRFKPRLKIDGVYSGVSAHNVESPGPFSRTGQDINHGE